MASKDQLLLDGMGNMISISLPAVKIVMDLYSISDQKDCLNKVLDFFEKYRQEINLKREEAESNGG